MAELCSHGRRRYTGANSAEATSPRRLGQATPWPSVPGDPRSDGNDFLAWFLLLDLPSLNPRARTGEVVVADGRGQQLQPKLM